MEPDIQIRVASESDLTTLVRLAGAFRDHLERCTPTDAEFSTSIATLLTDPQTEFLLAGDAGPAALGYVQARYRYSAWAGAPEAEIEDVFVIPAARGRGVGLRLLSSSPSLVRPKEVAGTLASTPTNAMRVRSRCTNEWDSCANDRDGREAGSSGWRSHSL